MFNGGVLPLDLLEARMMSWVTAQKAAGKMASVTE
jgi:hypothetical protein